MKGKGLKRTAAAFTVATSLIAGAIYMNSANNGQTGGAPFVTVTQQVSREQQTDQITITPTGKDVQKELTPTVSIEPSPTERIAPTEEPTQEPTPEIMEAPSVTPTEAVTPTPTVTITNTPTPTEMPTPSPTVTSTPIPTKEPTPKVTPTPIPTKAPTPTPKPTNTPTPSPTMTPTPTPDPLDKLYPEGTAWEGPRERKDIAAALMANVNAFRASYGLRKYEDPFVYDLLERPGLGTRLTEQGDRVCKDLVLNWGKMHESNQISAGTVDGRYGDIDTKTLADYLFKLWETSKKGHRENMLDGLNEKDGLGNPIEWDGVYVSVMDVYQYWDGHDLYTQAVMTTSLVGFGEVSEELRPDAWKGWKPGDPHPYE